MRTIRWMFLPLLFLCALTFTACNGNANLDNDQERLQRPTEIINEAFLSEREQLQREVQHTQDDLTNKIVELRAEKEEASASAQAETEETIKELDVMLKELNVDMKKLGENVEDNWDEFRENENWSEFSNSLRDRIQAIDRKLLELGGVSS